jgi:hypothetical protein
MIHDLFIAHELVSLSLSLSQEEGLKDKKYL